MHRPTIRWLAAAQAAADAEAAVAVARLALIEAHRAALVARGAALRAGDSEAVAAAVRGFRPLSPGNPVLRHGLAVGGGVTEEVSTVLRRRPRSILVKLAIGLGLGLAYLVFILLMQWEDKSEILPYLAPYALSGVIGGVVCTNALSWDAGRVRAELTGGRRLWHVLISKNVTMFLLVGAVGLVLCLLLAWQADDYGALVKALGELVTMMLLWLGIGNVLSVLSPLRVEPLKERFKDGTWKPFLLSFAISYVVGLGVNLMLTWRVWAKQSMIEDLGGPWVPTLMLIVSALSAYLLLTVLAVGLADQPRVRRALLREMIDYKAAKAAQAAGSRERRGQRARVGLVPSMRLGHRLGTVSTSNCCPPPASTDALTGSPGASRESLSTNQSEAWPASVAFGQRPTTSRPPLRVSRSTVVNNTAGSETKKRSGQRMTGVVAPFLVLQARWASRSTPGRPFAALEAVK